MAGGGGGKSASTTSTATTTNNTDKRLVVDGGSYGISADGGSVVNLQTSDMGAIAGAGQVALSALANNATNLDHLLSAADRLFAKQAETQAASVKLTQALAGTAQTAYADAAAQASGNKNLILAALAVVGVVGLSAFKK